MTFTIIKGSLEIHEKEEEKENPMFKQYSDIMNRTPTGMKRSLKKK